MDPVAVEHRRIGIVVALANDGTITIIGDSGTAYGIYGEGKNTIINRENGIIDVSGTDAYGIYVKDGTDTYIKNDGIIYANGEFLNFSFYYENMVAKLEKL